MPYRYSNGIPPDILRDTDGGFLWESGGFAQRVRWDSVQGNGDCKSTVGGGHLTRTVLAAVSTLSQSCSAFV